MDSSPPLSVDRHVVSFVAPCIVRILWLGDVTDEQAQRIRQFFQPYERLPDTLWVTDLSRLGRIPLSVLKILGSREVDATHPRRVRLCFAGANLRTKLAVTGITRLANWTSDDEVSSHFFDTLEETDAFARREAAKL